MACPPTSSTARGTTMRAPRRSAPASSTVPTAVASASTATNMCRSNSSDARMTVPNPTPTQIAAGRFRPARDRRRTSGTIAAARSGEEAVTGSDFEQLGLLVLDQIVDLVDVSIGGALQLLLRAPHLVLAGLTVAGDAVQLLHRFAADAAHGDPGLLALATGDLDHLLAAFLGQLRDDHSDDLPVVARVDTQIG